MYDHLSNFVQIANEVVVLICTWLIFQFTMFVPAAEVRYHHAWYFLYFTAANIAFNIVVFLFLLIRKIYTALKLKILARRQQAKILEANKNR